MSNDVNIIDAQRESLSKFWGALCCVSFSNFSNLIFAQFVCYYLGALDETIFSLGVFHVFVMRAKKKMIGIYAGAVVAFVAYLKIAKNWTESVLPHKSVRSNSLIPSLEISVTAFILRTAPLPAGFGFFNQGKEKTHCVGFARLSIANFLTAVSRLEVFAATGTLVLNHKNSLSLVRESVSLIAGVLNFSKFTNPSLQMKGFSQ